MSSISDIVQSTYEVFVLHEGYSIISKDSMKANCSCTLIKGNKNIIVDTMTPWDKELILESLKKHNVEADNIDYVVSTHGHSDHCGNNNLFLNATHIMGYCISNKDIYVNHSFENGLPYKIDDYVNVVPTPGHTTAHVSVVVRTKSNEIVVAAGDLFENENDLTDDSVWKNAGSENELEQTKSREKILELADWIIPGHGKMFKVKRNQ